MAFIDGINVLGYLIEVLIIFKYWNCILVEKGLCLLLIIILVFNWRDFFTYRKARNKKIIIKTCISIKGTSSVFTFHIIWYYHILKLKQIKCFISNKKQWAIFQGGWWYSPPKQIKTIPSVKLYCNGKPFRFSCYQDLSVQTDNHPYPLTNKDLKDFKIFCQSSSMVNGPTRVTCKEDLPH